MHGNTNVTKNDNLTLHESGTTVQEFPSHLVLYQSAVSTILKETNKYFYARITQPV